MALELAGGLAATEADRLLQAEALVRAYCGWHIAPVREDEEYKVRVDPGTSVVLLPSLHVTAVAVTVAGVELVADTHYTWSDDGVLKSYWWSTASPIEVVFSHGYATAPAEVAAVVQAVAERAISNPGSVVRRQAGPFGETYSQSGFNQAIPLTLLDAEKAILDPYVIPSRP